jgi:HEAT repeat protein
MAAEDFGARLDRWRASIGSLVRRGGQPVRGESEETLAARLDAAEPGLRWRAAAALGRNPLLGEQATAALVRALAGPDEITRWEAMRALARQEPGRAFATLSVAVDDADPRRRAAAAQALGWVGGEAAALLMRRRLADPAAEVRAGAARGLGLTRDPGAVEPLVGLLGDPSPEARCAAAEALGRIGATVAACPLAEALAAPGQPVLARRAMAAALVRAAHPDTQPTLLSALADPDPQVRAYAADALGQVGGESAHGPLAQLTSDRSPLIRGAVGDRAAQAMTMLERRGRNAARATER